MDEEIGKWLLDISKYIITAYILSQMFGKDNDSWWSFIGAVLLAVLLFALGYYLIKKGKDKNKKGKYTLPIIHYSFYFPFLFLSFPFLIK